MIKITLKIEENGQDIEHDYLVDDVYHFEAISQLADMYDILKESNNIKF